MLKLLHELEGKDNRRAQFRTAISLILDEKEYLFEGIIKGEIIKEKEVIPDSDTIRYSFLKDTTGPLPN